MANQILIVDDEEPVRTLYSILLGSYGFDIETAPDGLEALEHIETNRPDLILLDIKMPLLSGWDVLRLIRSNPETRDIPVVVVTAFRDTRSAAESWLEGCTFHMTKPICLEELLLLMHRVLEEAPPLTDEGRARVHVTA